MGGGIAIDYRELNVIGAREEGFPTQFRHAERRVAVPTKGGPGIDARAGCETFSEIEVEGSRSVPIRP